MNTALVLLITSTLTFPNGVTIHESKTVSAMETRGQCEMLKPEFEELERQKQDNVEIYYGLDTEMEIDMECLTVGQLQAIATEKREAMEE